MGHAVDDLGPGPRRNACGLHLLFPGDAVSVRRALSSAAVAFRAMDVGPELRGVVEIVLAEVLNNVVEHAYHDRGRGLIELEADPLPGAIAFRVRDDGAPMPGDTAPAGQHSNLEVPLHDLPEGGFGWLLIRELTRDLVYRRIGNRNELTFMVPFNLHVGN